MLRIGIVGIGDIAKKAYLPVLSNMSDVELVLCSRDQIELNRVCAQYKIKESYTNYDEFLKSNLDGLFITAATKAHFDLSLKAIEMNIPFHLDKPISLSFDESRMIFDSANDKGLGFTVGFNRRFTPMIQKIMTMGKPNFVVYQKNRLFKEDDIRRFIVEDFIHVIDTTRYLLQNEVIDIKASGNVTKEGLLKHVIIHLKTVSNEAICIMNYRNGITEERVEVNFDDQQFLINDYYTLTEVNNDCRVVRKSNDWTPTLQTRGFENMCRNFVDSIANGKEFFIDAQDALESHIIAEKIVKQLEVEKNKGN